MLARFWSRLNNKIAFTWHPCMSSPSSMISRDRSTLMVVHHCGHAFDSEGESNPPSTTNQQPPLSCAQFSPLPDVGLLIPFSLHITYTMHEYCFIIAFGSLESGIKWSSIRLFIPTLYLLRKQQEENVRSTLQMESSFTNTDEWPFY